MFLTHLMLYPQLSLSCISHFFVVPSETMGTGFTLFLMAANSTYKTSKDPSTEISMPMKKTFLEFVLEKY
jgi:hypothetical protein